VPIIRQAVSDNVMASLAPLIGSRLNFFRRLAAIVESPRSTAVDRAGAVVRIIFALELLGIIAIIAEQVWKGFDLLAGVFFAIKLIAKLTLAFSTEGSSLIIAGIVALVDDAAKIVTEAVQVANTCGASTTPLVVTVAGGDGVLYNLAGPTGIALDGSNNLYVVDSPSAQLKKWAPGKTDFVAIAMGNAKPEWGTSDWAPSFVAVDGNSNSYVGDVVTVSKFVAGEPVQAGMHAIFLGNGQFQGRPGGIVVDGNGSVYASDTVGNVVLRFDPGATTGTVIAGEPGKLNRPSGIARDAAGNLYVVDSGNNRVLKYVSGGGDGLVIAGGNGAGAGPTQLDGASGIAVDAAGNVYVADTHNHRVLMYEPGKPAGSIGVPVAGGQGAGNGIGQLNSPADVKIDGQSMLYIADTGNNRVQKWDLGEN
jgi:sugar lactone lactonase YvrE